MQAFSITYCPVESHLPVLVKVKKILAKRPSYACVETHVILVTANMVHEHIMMMMILKKFNQIFNQIEIHFYDRK